MKSSKLILSTIFLFLLTLISIITILLFSGHTNGLSADFDSPNLFENETEELLINFSSEEDSELNGSVHLGRKGFGGSSLLNFSFSLESGEVFTVKVNLTPRIGYNPIFVYATDEYHNSYEFNTTLVSYPKYSDVLLILNNRSSLSKEIGEHFLKNRNIEHTLFLNTSKSETISRQDFGNTILYPLKNYLENNSLEEKINYFVTTKDIPLRIAENDTSDDNISYPNTFDRASVDSEIRLLNGPYEDNIGGGGRNFNPYFRENYEFSFKKYGVYLTTRLTGYNISEIKALSANASTASLAPPKDGNFILDVDPGRDGGGYEVANNWLRNANSSLIDSGYNSFLDENNTYVTHQKNVSGYTSWGSNDHHDTDHAKPHNHWLPGSLAETYVSTSARTFDYPPSYGQSLIADIIYEGVTGVKGYVYEPYLDTCAHPDLLFPAYTRGFNLAESFYTASNYVGWMDVVVGDPKISPYSFLPEMTISETRITRDKENSMVQKFEITAANQGGTETGNWNMKLTVYNSTQTWNFTFDGMPLFPGEFFHFKQNWTAPEPGRYDYTITIIHEEKEQNELNNELSGKLKVLSKPDLYPWNYHLNPAVPEENTTFSVFIELKNTGESSANDVNLSLYLNNEYFASRWVDVDGFGNIFCLFNLTLTPGFHRLKAEADPGDFISESNETNNIYDFEIKVNALPVILLPDEVTIRSGEKVEFNSSDCFDPDGNITYVGWNIQGEEKIGKVAEHSFMRMGNYSVTCSIRDNNGSLSQSEIIVIVKNSPPVPRFQLPLNLRSHENFTFDASSSYDNDSQELDYYWDFGDDIHSNNALESHSYPVPGEYRLSVTVWDEMNVSGTLTKILVIENRKPEMMLSGEYNGNHYPVQALPELDLLSHTQIIFNFSGSSDRDGQIVFLDAEFDDGNNYHGNFKDKITHSFEYSRAYNVRFTLMDNNHSAVTKNLTISVSNTPPIPDFIFTPEKPCSFQEFQLISTSTDNGFISSYSWSIQGETLQGKNVTHSFDSWGFYDVRLTVTDDEGEERAFLKRVEIRNLRPDIEADDMNCKEGELKRIEWGASDRDGLITKYEITFPDGEVKSTEKKFMKHVFKKSGEFNLTITAIDDVGARSLVNITVHVEKEKDGGSIPSPSPVSGIAVGAGVLFLVYHRKRNQGSFSLPQKKKTSFERLNERRISCQGLIIQMAC